MLKLNLLLLPVKLIEYLFPENDYDCKWDL